MKTCSHNHPEIIHDEVICPLCSSLVLAKRASLFLVIKHPELTSEYIDYLQVKNNGEEKCFFYEICTRNKNVNCHKSRPICFISER